MNKYDDIKTLLFTNMSVMQSCEFLLNFLKNYCLKPYNREKIDSYYNNLAEILKKLLYFPNENKLNFQNSKYFQSLLQVLNLRTSNFEDFDIALNLFLVPTNLENDMNLFSSIFIHNYGNTKFLFPITNSAYTNRAILSYLNNNKNEIIFNTFGIFQILSQSKDDQIRYLAKKELILTIREYYIFIILNFIKKASNIIKINIKENYPNYKKYFENIPQNIFFSKKTHFIIDNFERNRSINYNFYNILFLDLIIFMNLSNNFQNQKLIEILTLAVQFLWLGDYHLFPQNEFYLESIYTQNHSLDNFDNFGNKNQTNFNYAKNYTNEYLIGSVNKDKYQTMNINFVNLLNAGIPNLLVLNCLKNLICLLQSKKYFFDEIIVKNEKISVPKGNILLMNLQNSLFNLFKYGFSLYSKSENKNSEVSLCDFASIWYTFITPWESPFNNTEGYSTYNENENKKFGFFSWNYDKETESKNHRFLKSFKKNSSPLKNILNMSSNSKNKVFMMDYLPYIEINIHFYTDLFQDYLNAYSNYNIMSIEELNILINCLEIFEISPNGSFINEFIKYPMLRDYSNGILYNMTKSGFIENLINAKPYLRRFIFPFDIEENINQVKKIIFSLKNLIFKISNTSDDRIEDSTKFILKLEHSMNILKSLYRISENEIQIKGNINTSVRDSSNVYNKRIFLENTEFENPWKRKISNFLRKRQRRIENNGEINPPVTNLRYLCNYYNLISTIGILIFFYIILKLIIIYLY